MWRIVNANSHIKAAAGVESVSAKKSYSGDDGAQGLVSSSHPGAPELFRHGQGDAEDGRLPPQQTSKEHSCFYGNDKVRGKGRF